MSKSILLALAAIAASTASAATIAERSGELTFQCCFFNAATFSWTQLDTWSNVQIELDLYHSAGSGEVRAGVAYLTNSIGPGTTEAANEIDEAILAIDEPGQHRVIAFTGLTLEPGTYHVTYHRVGGDQGNFLALAFAGGDLLQLGPGITLGSVDFEEDEAAYRPASVFEPYYQNSPLLFRITGDLESTVTPVPEPASGVAAALGLGLILLVGRANWRLRSGLVRGRAEQPVPDPVRRARNR